MPAPGARAAGTRTAAIASQRSAQITAVKDLGRLAKAAKLDPAKEDAAFIAEIIEAPALAKAACEFWRAYAGPIVALGKESPRARGAL